MGILHDLHFLHGEKPLDDPARSSTGSTTMEEMELLENFPEDRKPSKTSVLHGEKSVGRGISVSATVTLTSVADFGFGGIVRACWIFDYCGKTPRA